MVCSVAIGAIVAFQTEVGRVFVRRPFCVSCCFSHHLMCARVCVDLNKRKQVEPCPKAKVSVMAARASEI